MLKYTGTVIETLYLQCKGNSVYSIDSSSLPSLERTSVCRFTTQVGQVRRNRFKVRKTDSGEKLRRSLTVHLCFQSDSTPFKL